MDGPGPFACPRCRSDLLEGTDGWSCLGCDSTFPALLGIPDLRTAEDAYLPNRADWEHARRLAQSFAHLDFRGLLERYFDLAPDIPPHLRHRQIAHILSAPDRARQWLDALELPNGRGPILDLGCGTGSFLAAVGGHGRRLVGVDIAMRWLIVARKRLDEAGLTRVHLACGCAENLPLRDGVCAGVVAGDVIEHVADQAATLAECHRVLAPGGRVFLASPNRFSLSPEPHVQVWGVGYLPRAWMGSYVRFRTGLDYRAIHNLGFDAWRRLLRRSPFGGGRLSAPGLPAGDLAHFGQFKRTLARLYNRLVTTAPGQAAALRIGPLFHVVCTRPDVEARTPIRPTRPGSRPTRAARSSARP
jgi:SAM-dependent methyltransferase